MNSYQYVTARGNRAEVTADRVEFPPGGAAVFWSGDVLTLAVPAGDWFDLRQVKREKYSDD